MTTYQEDIANEIMERVPFYSLITGIRSVVKRFFVGGGVEGDVDRPYSMIRVSTRLEQRGTKRLGDGGETDRE